LSLQKHKWRFIKSLVDDAPDTPGVYALWDADTLVYIGRAERGESIRSHLLAHLRGEIGSDTCMPRTTAGRFAETPRSARQRSCER